MSKIASQGSDIKTLISIELKVKLRELIYDASLSIGHANNQCNMTEKIVPNHLRNDLILLNIGYCQKRHITVQAANRYRDTLSTLFSNFTSRIITAL